MYPVKQRDELALEITVLSANSLKRPSSSFLFPSRLRPYVALSSTATSAELRTRVDETGSHNPTWGDTVRVPVDPSFLQFGSTDAAVHVSVLSRGPSFAGPAMLGWCRVSPADVVDGLHPPATWRRLSYALKKGSYGGRGDGVVHLAVRMLRPPVERAGRKKELEVPKERCWASRVAIGIPVAFPPAAAGGGSRGKERVVGRGGR